MWIGRESVVTPGVKIDGGVITAVDSVVAEDVPPYSVAPKRKRGQQIPSGCSCGLLFRRATEAEQKEFDQRMAELPRERCAEAPRFSTLVELVDFISLHLEHDDEH